MRVAPCLILAACLAVAGCNAANRRPSGGGDGVFLGAGPQANARKPETGDPLSNTATTAPDVDGMLAGQVLDSLSGRPVAAKIRYVCLDDPKARDGGGEPAAADAHGHYVIQGLKAGRRYKLVATAKVDGRTLIGVQYTMAPDPRALIKLSEDLSGSGGGDATPTPPPPAPPAGKAAEPEPKKATSIRAPERPASAQVPVPVWGAPTVGAVPVPNPDGAGLGIRAPGPANVQELPAAGGRPPWDRPPPSTWPVPGVPAAPERMAQGNVPAWQPPLVQMPGAKRPQPVPEIPLTPATAPSCVLVGDNLINFALRDLNLQTWEYRQQKRGKLMLVDFWSLSCVPCLQSLPYLRDLQDRYGSSGLDVVGITYEAPGNPHDQAERVRGAAQRYKLNYPLLLGGGAQCPVKSAFRVRAYPTLFLVSPTGAVIWTHEGRLEPHHLRELEHRIQIRLSTN